MTTDSSVSPRLLHIGWVTAASVYVLWLFEWLFLVTKPSMFTLVGWTQRGAILLAAALVTSIPAVVAAVLLAFSWGRVAGRWRKHATAAALVVPAVLLSAAGLLLFENFTKTVFRFNLGSFTSPVRYLYAIGWLLLALWIHRALGWRAGPSTRQLRGARMVGAMLLLAASALAAWLRYEPQQAVESIAASAIGELPNILILSTDGLNATHMSVYGYERPTTPFLESRADEFLVSENHFSNSVVTSASIGAMLSGKPPMDTGVLRAGNAFRGVHVFQHLPGLLRQLGYYNIDISARFYGDAYDMNIRQGFHVANGRSLKGETLPVVGWVGRAFPSEFYFVSLTAQRLRERFLHAAGLADMRDFYDVVAKKFTPWIRDDDRIALLEAEIARAPGPFFAHVHLLDTHRLPRSRHGPGPARQEFPVRKPHYSVRADPQWYDYYDDTIVGYDDYVRQVMTRLEASNKLDKTLLIVSSDHGERRWARLRLPLMMRFPDAEHRGRIVANTQRLDIAPTILSYLGLERPDWMVGQSLIDAELDPLRPILVAGEGRKQSVRRLSIVQCQRSYDFTVATATMAQYPVDGHTAPCAEQDLLGEAEARRRLFERLDVTGRFAVPLPIQLASLQRDNNPQMRQKAVDAIERRQAPALWLGKTIAVAQVHPDFWTDGTRPAAILLRNDGKEPRAHELVVGSGQGTEFPASFFIQDDKTTREHVFSDPGFISVDLGRVPPGSERLLLVWSDGAWVAEDGGRQRGIRLLLSGTWLQGLLHDERTEKWQQAAQLILERRVPTVSLDDLWLATNVYGDLWTRGAEPAGLAVRNGGDEPMTRRLVVRSGKGHDFPLRLHLDDGDESREYVFERSGSLTIDLPEVPPRSERLFIVRSASAWIPDSRTRRELGVRLSPG